MLEPAQIAKLNTGPKYAKSIKKVLNGKQQCFAFLFSDIPHYNAHME